MATPVADRAVLDTNVLLAATDEARQEHEHAVAAINLWPASGLVLYTSGQIMREYLAVATRPVDQNGLGMARPDAVANVRALRARLNLLAEDIKVSTACWSYSRRSSARASRSTMPTSSQPCSCTASTPSSP